MKRYLWRIYYGDGTTFDNTQGEPEDAPPVDVQVIIQPNKDSGRQTIHQWDWYYWRNGLWYGSDIWGLLDQLLWNNVTAVKQGRTLSNEDHEKIMKKAMADPDFAPQTAIIPGDRPKQAYGDGSEYYEE
jgi:hypothetical protein